MTLVGGERVVRYVDLLRKLADRESFFLAQLFQAIPDGFHDAIVAESCVLCIKLLT